MFFKISDYLISFIITLIILLSLVPKRLIPQSSITVTISALVAALLLGTLTNKIRYLIFKSKQNNNYK